jgi:hypothetical protein
MSTPYSWAWGGVGMTEAAEGRLSGGGRRWRTWGRGREQTATVGAEAVGSGGGRGGSDEGSNCGRRWPMAGVKVGAAVEAEAGSGSLERMG